MALERQPSKSEIGSQKKVIQLPRALGDWTNYKAPDVQIRKVRSGLYGFDRLSKEDLNLLLLIHYRFIQHLFSDLKVDLRLAIEILSLQVEQTTYLTFLRTLSGPMVQCKIQLPETHESILLFIDLPLANTIINYSLGSVDIEDINRGLTEAEQTVLTTSLSKFMPALRSIYENVIGEPTLSIVSSPDVIIDPTINTDSTFASFSATVSLADNPPGKIQVGYVGNYLKNILARYRKAEESRPLDFSRLPASLLAKVKNRLTVTLGETQLMTGELSSLEVGDVVLLENPIDAPLPASIGKTLTLPAQPGNRNKKSAVRLVGLKGSADIELPPPEVSSPSAPTPVPAPTPISTPAPNPALSPLPKEEIKEEEDLLGEEDLLDEDLGEEEFEEEFPEDEFPEDKL
ncbi:MAG: FliM/FliN family flagellar motor switch protein [Candidatus Margulisiibacteriota bacterium]